MLRLGICTACLSDAAKSQVAVLQATIALSDLAGQVAVDGLTCGDTCPAPAQVWLQAPGAASYIFAGVDLAQDRDDILATLRAYLAHPGGWIEDARPCGRLRFCLTARLPG